MLPPSSYAARGVNMARLLIAFLSLLMLQFNVAFAKDIRHQSVENNSDDKILLTIFLKHDQSRNLEKIDAQLEEQKFFELFPPEGVDVVSWYVMMGIGQVVTLRLSANKLREVNRIVENSAWGAFRTEFYPTYDYSSIAKRRKLSK